MNRRVVLLILMIIFLVVISSVAHGGVIHTKYATCVVSCEAAISDEGEFIGDVSLIGVGANVNFYPSYPYDFIRTSSGKQSFPSGYNQLDHSIQIVDMIDEVVVRFKVGALEKCSDNNYVYIANGGDCHCSATQDGKHKESESCSGTSPYATNNAGGLVTE